ncbi:PREDICTED: uncharacterized protein LOC109206439 [Nicotiana attenuata]|uniref:uncharacterized protein LOC109206439 n=1 Tax=Nicotiana attenuata TaxID=49451 RepID=UPI000905AF89|nr:PREDICTED: uncharacterized protein LOC109206439 [Nicotiana attenuata]
MTVQVIMDTECSITLQLSIWKTKGTDRLHLFFVQSVTQLKELNCGIRCISWRDMILLSCGGDFNAGFVKGRSIVENILLTQEIITDIRLRTKAGPNVVIKLYMTKAYDRISWLFLTKVLKKMGFNERFIGLVYGIVSNNWYSVLLSGQPHGFFKSSRGVKQGDPLSPTLFILAAEALSRGLNSLHRNFYFCGCDATSLQLIMEVFGAYEMASGQLINKSKSAIYLHHSVGDEVIDKVQRITGIGKQEFPFTYLGYPISYTRRKMDHYQGVINKVLDKLQSWKGKLLSIGGVAVLISHVLQSMPIHLLSSVNPPGYVINKLHKLFARFFWSNSVDGRNFCYDESIHNVYDVASNGAWDVAKIHQILPQDIASHIIDNIGPLLVQNVLDKPNWMLETRGNFLLNQHGIFKGNGKIPISTTLQSLVKVREPSLLKVPHNWSELIHVMENYTPALKTTKVIWKYPEPGWIKVNTDGASRGNPGRSSYGFVLRNEEGEVMYACGKEIDEGTNNEAEARAILEALRYCLNHDYVLIEWHTDPMVMTNVFQGTWTCPWNMEIYVEEIKEMMTKGNIQISHTLREGNQLADHLANFALEFGPIVCREFCDLDVLGRKIVNNDKLQWPYLRIKAKRR